MFEARVSEYPRMVTQTSTIAHAAAARRRASGARPERGRTMQIHIVEDAAAGGVVVADEI